MALRQTPFSMDEVRRIIADMGAFRAPPVFSWDTLFEPGPDVLHYFAKRDEIVRGEPGTFYWGLDDSPSNCTWMMGANGPPSPRRSFI
jgi:hypothetical protein